MQDETYGPEDISIPPPHEMHNSVGENEADSNTHGHRKVAVVEKMLA